MKIPFSPPDIGQAEIDAVVETLKSSWITTGPKTEQLSQKVAQCCHVPYAACMNSATACHEMSLRLLGIGSGDEVIVPAYTYTASASVIEHVGAVPVIVDVEKGTFHISYEEVLKAITPKTKAIILNSPSNPTGAVMEKEDIKAIADLSMDHDFLIISDEIYEKIIYDKKHYSPAKYSDNVITLNGFSKTYAMTGLRIGYLTANEEYTEELLKIHQYNIACASTVSQRGAYEALTGPQDEVTKMVNEFKNRRDLIVKRLNEMGYETVNAEGAFYVFPKIEDKEFVQKAAEAGVITVPGAAFGSNGENHVRMSYANSYENIEKAMNILEERVVNG